MQFNIRWHDFKEAVVFVMYAALVSCCSDDMTQIIAEEGNARGARAIQRERQDSLGVISQDAAVAARSVHLVPIIPVAEKPESVESLDYALLKKGDILRLCPFGEGGRESCFLYTYKNERYLRVKQSGRYLMVNGRIVGAVISDEGFRTDTIALKKHATSIQAIVWLGGSGVSIGIIEAIRALSTRRLHLTFGRMNLTSSSLRKLSYIADRVDALHLIYPETCGDIAEMRRLNTQMNRVFEMMAEARAVFVTPAGVFDNRTSIEDILGVRNLLGLYAQKIYVDDRRLRRITRVSSLRYLEVKSQYVTDDGLSSISSSTSLRRLALVDTQVTDRGLAQVARLKYLQSLVLVGRFFNGSGLRYLSGNRNLLNLFLFAPSILERNMVYLKLLRSLRCLDLTNTPISDAAIPHLREVVNLKYISLLDTKITEEGAQKLKNENKIEIVVNSKGKSLDASP